MEDGNGTTLWVDRWTKDGLRKLAKANDRSVAGQLRFMVKRDLAEIGEVQQEQSEPEEG